MATGTVGVVIAGAAAFSAFEAHIINVTATIQNAMDVPVDSMDFGTVFPEEKFDQNFTLGLSSSFIGAVSATTTEGASFVVAFNQALRKDGSPVPPDRSDPSHALGMPQTTGAPFDASTSPANFVSLGFGGSLTLGFDHFIVNNGGSEVKDFEVTGGPSYPDEKVDVYAAQATSGPWTLLKAGSIKDDQIDLGPLPWAKYVKLVDVSDKNLFEATADGFDVDAVTAINQTRAGLVDYMIRQKPKCVSNSDASVHPQVTEDEEGNFVCPQGSTMMPLLCPYLSKHEISTDGTVGENDGSGINAFHGLPGPWTEATTEATQVTGELNKGANDVSDTWNIDLKTPCFKGQCAQDWASYVHTYNPSADPLVYQADPKDEHKTFGCDLWVEITGIQ